MNRILVPFSFLALVLAAPVRSESPESPALRPVARDPGGHGMLCMAGEKRVLFLEGAPEQMGAAHGRLLKSLIPRAAPGITSLIGAAYTVKKGRWFYDTIDEITRRSLPHTPERFLTELRAMAKAAGIRERDAVCLNFFPELFHCSGVAVRNAASADGRVIHARVLDYMRDIRLQKLAVLQVFLPENGYPWVSVGYAGFIGTVTAMNEKGLAIGELGGHGEGDWDGMPMSLLLREVVENAATVQEALAILRTTPRTCEYYYVLSDAGRDMAGVYATPDTFQVLAPGEQDDRLPPVPEETVLFSGGRRADVLSERLHKYYGRITPERMIEIIKRPVAMRSNLHNAIFLPETLDLWFSDAGAKTPACDEPYTRVNLRELIDFYRAERP